MYVDDIIGLSFQVYMIKDLARAREVYTSGRQQLSRVEDLMSSDVLLTWTGRKYPFLKRNF